MECVVEPAYLQHDENNLHDDPHRHAVFHVEVQEPVDLAGRVQVEE